MECVKCFMLNRLEPFSISEGQRTLDVKTACLNNEANWPFQAGLTERRFLSIQVAVEHGDD